MTEYHEVKWSTVKGNWVVVKMTSDYEPGILPCPEGCTPPKTIWFKNLVDATVRAVTRRTIHSVFTDAYRNGTARDIAMMEAVAVYDEELIKHSAHTFVRHANVYIFDNIRIPNDGEVPAVSDNDLDVTGQKRALAVRQRLTRICQLLKNSEHSQSSERNSDETDHSPTADSSAEQIHIELYIAELKEIAKDRVRSHRSMTLKRFFAMNGLSIDIIQAWYIWSQYCIRNNKSTSDPLPSQEIVRKEMIENLSSYAYANTMTVVYAIRDVDYP